MNNWKDETNGEWVEGVYQVTETKGSRIKHGDFSLYVHHHFDYPKNTWLASCRGLCNNLQLKSTDISDAKLEAESHLKSILEKALESINDFSGKDKNGSTKTKPTPDFLNTLSEVIQGYDGDLSEIYDFREYVLDLVQNPHKKESK